MTGNDQIQDQIAVTVALLRERLGVRGKTLRQALRRAKHRLPRRVYRRAMILARVENMVDHPKLRLTLNSPQLLSAAGELQTFLRSIDLADRRKGWWLGMLGGLAFNILVFAVLLLAFLAWRKII
ncbi:hypothetical protein [Ruegeria marina]|uniref:Uncharacterized protein n=1 Tax=Ruegeria marina TaxID=639004 RepID=A0A1G6LBL5_9RHOB|nr:hypothetical protein [Ruegeria marina]SDC40135.1 hypothetical protein SAMN04488239_102189 [Ruegeria marina]